MQRATSLLASALFVSLPLMACADSKPVQIPVQMPVPGMVPVVMGGNTESDACGAIGQVKGLKAGGDGFLAVRSGPGTTYPVVDKIGNGQLLYLCDSIADGAWLGVVYASDDDDCGVTSPSPSRQPYRGRCRVGWVKAAWVEVVAG